MKRFLLLLAFNVVFIFSFAQGKVFISLVDEYEGELITLTTDTLSVTMYYNFTGYETVGSIVLNIITIFNDGSESRKELDVQSYSKNLEENTISVTVIRDDKELNYIFYTDTNMILMMLDDGTNVLMSGDVIF
jgi:hypothetical protein